MEDLSQYVLSGLSQGCIYALVALALVIVANVTGVFNFATGEYVMLGGMITAVTAAEGWPLALCAVAAMCVVSAVAVAQERLTVAPVRGKMGALGMVIVSLGVGVAIRGAALLIWEEDPREAPAWDAGTFHFLGASLSDQTIWVWVTTALCLAAVTLLFTRTDLGRAMRASAINPTAARLSGIKVGTTSMLSFALAGALCGLVAAATVSETLVRWDSGINIGLIGFIAAALAGFTSPARAVLAGLGLGVVEAISAGWISSDYRTAIVYGTLIVYLLVRDVSGREGTVSAYLRSRRASAAKSEDAPELRDQVRARLSGLAAHMATEVAPNGRRLQLHPMMAVPAVALVVVWLLVTSTDDLNLLDTAVFTVLAAMGATGLVMIIGLAGQFSLGQAAFFLVSGYAAGILTAKHGWDPMTALLAAVAGSAVLGYVVGFLTLRLRGLNLALATLSILLIGIVIARQEEDLTGGTLGLQGVAGLKIFGKEIEEPKDYFLFCLVVLAVMMLIARNVYRSRMGRALRAIGVDDEAAEAVGLDPFTLKLRVFVLGSVFAAIAGVLWVYYLRFAAPATWDVKLTIDLVTYVVVGGMLSPFGAALGAAVVGTLQYYIRDSIGTESGASANSEILISGLLLVVFLLVFRNGLAQAPQYVGQAYRWIRARGRPDEDDVPDLSEEETAFRVAARDRLVAAAKELEPLSSEATLVDVEGLTRRFGSLVAVSDVSFSLRPGRITAMIGPNGAGKSTVINMLSGTLLASEGAVGVMGKPAVGLRPQKIARLGLTRTFQTPRLFDGLTVLETVMLARDPHGSRFWTAGAALRTPRGLRDEREARREALAWLAFVGLEREADTIATQLPVGQQRMAEVARALATEPAVLLLDEPAAGLDGTETRALGELIRTIADVGIAVLLVEHDMGMVMSIADDVIVLEQGKKIAEGTPKEVGADQRVIDAYLGVVPA